VLFCGHSSVCARFRGIAHGSASELEYHLLLVRDLHLLPDSDHKHLAEETTEIKRMLTGLRQKLNAES
jgi:four helix bundle protein